MAKSTCSAGYAINYWFRF